MLGCLTWKLSSHFATMRQHQAWGLQARWRPGWGHCWRKGIKPILEASISTQLVGLWNLLLKLHWGVFYSLLIKASLTDMSDGCDHLDFCSAFITPLSCTLWTEYPSWLGWPWTWPCNLFGPVNMCGCDTSSGLQSVCRLWLARVPQWPTWRRLTSGSAAAPSVWASEQMHKELSEPSLRSATQPSRPSDWSGPQQSPAKVSWAIFHPSLCWKSLSLVTVCYTALLHQ